VRREPRRDPVVVLAAGAVTPLGDGLDTFWTALLTGADGISPIERFPVDGLRVRRGGEIKKLSLPPGRPAPECRASKLVIAAVEDLRRRAALDCPAARLSVVVGTALGGVDELDRALGEDRRPRRAASGLYDSPAHCLAGWIGAGGAILTVSTACASGATAMGVAADLLRADAADLVLAGGYDTLCPFVMRGFDSLRSLTRERVRPFDRRRSGLLLGEGAGLVLMAREADARGRPLLGRLRGHASTSDGSHVAAPDPEGRGLQLAIRMTLAQADAAPADVDFVSAHGTGTPLNDRIETAVLKRVLGRRAHEVPVNSIKGALGHTMGAAAAVEAIMCLLASRDGAIPQTVGFEEPDPECDLDYVPAAPRRVRPRLSLSTSLGFGGSNAALVLEGGP
jgi:3-oxoacyl-[acyl-carrier-protein] synthase II